MTLPATRTEFSFFFQEPMPGGFERGGEHACPQPLKAQTVFPAEHVIGARKAVAGRLVCEVAFAALFYFVKGDGSPAERPFCCAAVCAFSAPARPTGHRWRRTRGLTLTQQGRQKSRRKWSCSGALPKGGLSCL